MVDTVVLLLVHLVYFAAALAGCVGADCVRSGFFNLPAMVYFCHSFYYVSVTVLTIFIFEMTVQIMMYDSGNL